MVEACQWHSPMQWAVGTSAQGPGANGLSPRAPAWGPQTEPLSPGGQPVDLVGLRPQDVLCDGDSPCVSCAGLAQGPGLKHATTGTCLHCKANLNLKSKVFPAYKCSWL